jgi:predicted phage terminase large subunit-like protein
MPVSTKAPSKGSRKLPSTEATVQIDPAALARDSLLAYTIATIPSYVAEDFHRTIASTLEAVQRHELNRVIITMPPQYGKTTLAGEIFPAWGLGRNPDDRYIYITYNQDRADDVGRLVRNQFINDIHPKVFPSSLIDSRTTGTNNFMLQGHRGAYNAVGIDGPITGRGADFLIIDDPFKSREDADSPTRRQAVKNFYRAVAYTRLSKQGSIIIFHTRWHTDDLIGWLLKEHGFENWHVVNFPALDTTYDPAKPLYPSKHSLADLDRIRKVSGPREWSSLWLQTPVAGEGGEFKEADIQYYDRVQTAGMNLYLLVDPANEKKSTSDFTTMVVWGLAPDNNYYLLDAVRDRLDLTERAGKLIELHRKWSNPAAGQRVVVGYEKYGKDSDIQAIQLIQEAQNYRFPIIPLGGPLKKEDRIRRLGPLLRENRLYLPRKLLRTTLQGEQIDLISYFIQEELLTFPAGTFDDLIDAAARITDARLGAVFPTLKGEGSAGRVLEFRRPHPINTDEWASEGVGHGSSTSWMAS